MEIRKQIGMGFGWVQRWFAKPLDKGSIPSHASRLDMMFDALGGQVAARQMLKGAAFNKKYDPPEDLVLLARAAIWHLADDAKEARAKHVSLSKQLSALKRGAK